MENKPEGRKGMKRIMILSDIHGNLTALDRVLDSVDIDSMDYIMLLGDIIDYGPRSNEVAARIQELDQGKILVNIWGNHEKAVAEEDYERFSSERGRLCAKHTRSCLSKQTLAYIKGMNRKGRQEFTLCGRRCLAVHGSLEDVFWKSIGTENMDERYSEYDYVFSGHSHVPCLVEKFYGGGSAAYRGKKRTVFINPGSVGQPRNHDPCANFAVLEMEGGTATLHSLEYDFCAEMRLFSDKVDAFYRDRLEKGI